MLLVAALAVGAWIVWGVIERARAKHALMDPTAPKLERVQAVDRWAKLGREAVPELIEALNRKDAKTRELALLALAQIGRDARGAGPEVARLLGDPAEAVRGAALHALMRMGYPLEQELPAIVTLLSEKSASVREQAAEALESIGVPAIPAMCGVLDSPKPEARKHAVTLIGRLGEGDPQAIAAIHRAAMDPDDQVRGLAYRVLMFWNEVTLEEALAGLRDANLQIASDVAATVERVGGDAAMLVPDLVRLLERDETKRSALAGLWALGPAARAAAPDIVSLLETERFPELVLDVLGKIGAGEEWLAPHVEPYLLERSPYGDSCRAAANALKQISPEAARAAVPGLIEHLRDGSPRERVRAAAALSGLGNLAEAAVPALTEALSDSEEWARLYAARGLGEIGPSAEASVRTLLALAGDRSLSKRHENGHRTIKAMLREGAIRALGLIGAEPEMVVPALIDALRDEEESVRAVAALALGRLRADPPTVVPALESVLLDDSVLARKAAAIALGRYGPHADSAVPIFVAMADEDGEPPPSGSVASPAGEPFHVESKWQESYPDSFPLAPLYRRSVASFANEALRKIDSDALKQAEIDPERLREVP